MSDSVSIADPMLTYVSVYNEDTGERITSYVTGIHGDNIEDLQTLAASQYPDAIHVDQDAATYNNALQNDLLYIGGQYKEKPAPTEEEIRKQKLNALDSEYNQKISDVEAEMAKANAIGDADYFNDLKAEHETLVSEYTTKRGEV